MMKLFGFALVLAAGCATQATTTNEDDLKADHCGQYTTEQACDHHSACEWSAGCACPADEGTCPPCPAPECVSKPEGGGGSGSGSSGSGSGWGSGSSGNGSGSGSSGSGSGSDMG